MQLVCVLHIIAQQLEASQLQADQVRYNAVLDALRAQPARAREPRWQRGQGTTRLRRIRTAAAQLSEFRQRMEVACPISPEEDGSVHLHFF